MDFPFSLQASDCEIVLWKSDVQKGLCLSSVSHGTLVAANVMLTLLASEAILQWLLWQSLRVSIFRIWNREPLM